jgi:hypothetical protein
MQGTDNYSLRQALEDAEAFAEDGKQRSYDYDINSKSAFNAALYAAGAGWGTANAIYKVTQSEKANLLRDIIGNPFRPVVVNPDWITPTVLSLARAAYEERPGRLCGHCNGLGRTTPIVLGGYVRCDTCHATGHIEDSTLDPVRLAILSDALEEAGCTDEIILVHLRSPSSHVRGCWALDLLLGKE